MAINKDKTYFLYNYGGSAVSVTTKTGSYLLQGGTKDSPFVMPFSYDEIATINATGCALKCGLVFPSEDEKQTVYEEICHIIDWQNILTNDEIEDVLLNPTAEGLQKIVDIKNELYFERVYGIYISLVNAMEDVRPKVKAVVEARMNEFQNKQRVSKIVVKDIKETQSASVNEEIERLREQNKLLMEKMEAFMAAVNATPVTADVPVPAPVAEIDTSKSNADVSETSVSATTVTAKNSRGTKKKQ